VGRRAGRDPGDDGQAGARTGVLRTNGEPVHRRARKRRQVDERRGPFREDPPGRALDRHAFGVEPLRPLEDEALSLCDGDQLRGRAHR
jgi:hypothetical protein